MLRRLVIVALTAATLAGTAARAHKATEIFIPIGQSPGLSGKYTTIGKIVAVDTQNHTITVQDEQGEEHSAKITGEPKIWLDRSALALPNRPGTTDDLSVGSQCEVLYVYEGQERQDEAVWIKIRIDRAE